MAIDVAFCKLQLRFLINNANRAIANLDDGNSSGCERELEQAQNCINEVRVQCASLRYGSTAPRCNRITQKQARAELKALGMTIRVNEGEYRVTFKAMEPKQAEAVAHYTNDLDDAVATAHDMHARWQRYLRSLPT